MRAFLSSKIKLSAKKMWNYRVCIAVSSAVIFAIFAIAGSLFFVHLKWRKNIILCKKGDNLELQQLSLSLRTTTTASEKIKFSFDGSIDTLDGRIIDTSPPCKMLLESYTAEDLKKATADFDSSNLIEGSVFHGRLNGRNLAIKRINVRGVISKFDSTLFQTTVQHHPNIMRLFGTCNLSGDWSSSYSGLVFEYATNGSLKDWLHGGLAMKSHFIMSCNCFLNWRQRLKICLDIAMALNYMHNINYVHKNVKSRNIFFDDDFNAKLGYFGISRSAEDDIEESRLYSSSSNNNNHAFWSKGYLAPEYLHQGVISSKIDVYAYGVVLLEVLSGKTPIISNKGEGSVWLTEKIKSVWQAENEEGIKEWMDCALGEDYVLGEAVILAHIARTCIEENQGSRPTAAEIVEKLSKLVEKGLGEGGGDHVLSRESSSNHLVIEVANNV